MKIFSAEQIRRWDKQSIEEQQISSDTLMETAATACFRWLASNQFIEQPVALFCGKGNNGGDGLALARMLVQNNIPVNIYILELGKPGSNDFQLNLQRLHEVTANIHFIQSADFFPEIKKDTIIIDALFGTGLNKPLDGIALQLVKHLNEYNLPVISIDIPSGLFCDKTSKENTIIKATHTLSFQAVKLAFLMPENDVFVGEFHILPIGLSNQYEEKEQALHEIMDVGIIKAIIKPRNKFSHKGSFGHAALIAGSYGMMGAAILAAKGCMHTGSGKLTCYIPSCGYDILQIAVPEAMCKITGEKFLEKSIDVIDYSATGIGPGFGQHDNAVPLLKNILSTAGKPLVLDADALNTIASNSELVSLIPGGSVITPHPKEFERMFGATANDFERLQLAIEKAAGLNIYIVLKGHYTAIITPRGKVYFNNTGNAGMAKAGMGDVLTGMVTGLLSQQYTLPEAAMLAVYLHGLAGDNAASKYTQHAMQASDLVNCIDDAWKLLDTGSVK